MEETTNETRTTTTEKTIFSEADSDVAMKINNETVEKNEKNNEQQSNCYWYVTKLTNKQTHFFCFCFVAVVKNGI